MATRFVTPTPTPTGSALTQVCPHSPLVCVGGGGGGGSGHTNRVIHTMNNGYLPNSEDSDQSVHVRSLIRIVFRSLINIIWNLQNLRSKALHHFVHL